MTGIFIQNIESPAEIVANGYYGASFKTSVFDQENNTYILQNISMQELIEPIIDVSTTLVNNHIPGDTDIEVLSSAGLGVSDRIKVGNYIYKIKNIFGNNITIDKGLYESLIAGITITKKGNLGIYKVNLLLTELGNFTLIGKDNIFGLNLSKMIKVQPKSIETMQDELKSLSYDLMLMLDGNGNGILDSIDPTKTGIRGKML